MASLRQHTATTTCARCHRMFQPGERVMPAYIVQKVARNPTGREMGAFLGDDFELVHASCADPGLEGKIIGP